MCEHPSCRVPQFRINLGQPHCLRSSPPRAGIQPRSFPDLCHCPQGTPKTPLQPLTLGRPGGNFGSPHKAGMTFGKTKQMTWQRHLPSHPDLSLPSSRPSKAQSRDRGAQMLANSRVPRSRLSPCRTFRDDQAVARLSRPHGRPGSDPGLGPKPSPDLPPPSSRPSTAQSRDRGAQVLANSRVPRSRISPVRTFRDDQAEARLSRAHRRPGPDPGPAEHHAAFEEPRSRRKGRDGNRLPSPPLRALRKHTPRHSRCRPERNKGPVPRPDLGPEAPVAGPCAQLPCPAFSPAGPRPFPPSPHRPGPEHTGGGQHHHRHRRAEHRIFHHLTLPFPPLLSCCRHKKSRLPPA